LLVEGKDGDRVGGIGADSWKYDQFLRRRGDLSVPDEFLGQALNDWGSLCQSQWTDNSGDGLFSGRAKFFERRPSANELAKDRLNEIGPRSL